MLLPWQVPREIMRGCGWGKAGKTSSTHQPPVRDFPFLHPWAQCRSPAIQLHITPTVSPRSPAMPAELLNPCRNWLGAVCVPWGCFTSPIAGAGVQTPASSRRGRAQGRAQLSLERAPGVRATAPAWGHKKKYKIFKG